nr:substrate-binding domain-containing protein [Lachnospiraceae bacterium]
MKKKLLSVLLSMTMVAAVLAGCGSTAADTAAPAADAAAATEAAPAADTEAAPAADAATEAATEAAAAASASGGKRVAVAMPTQSSERWINDGANMKKQLEDLGYEVDLQYAEDDVQMQVSQIENMIASGANCLVIAAIDSGALVNVEDQAKQAG